MQFEIYLNIINYFKPIDFYKYININKQFNDLFFKNNIIFNYQINKFFKNLNNYSIIDNKNLFKYLLFIDYYLNNKHLNIINNDIFFISFLKKNNWAYKLYNYNFQININNQKIYDNSIKNNIIEIMKYIYFVKILSKIDNNKFLKIKYDIMEETINLRNDMYDYISRNYPNYLFY